MQIGDSVKIGCYETYLLECKRYRRQPIDNPSATLTVFSVFDNGDIAALYQPFKPPFDTGITTGRLPADLFISSQPIKREVNETAAKYYADLAEKYFATNELLEKRQIKADIDAYMKGNNG